MSNYFNLALNKESESEGKFFYSDSILTSYNMVLILTENQEGVMEVFDELKAKGFSIDLRSGRGVLDNKKFLVRNTDFFFDRCAYGGYHLEAIQFKQGIARNIDFGDIMFLVNRLRYCKEDVNAT